MDQVTPFDSIVIYLSLKTVIWVKLFSFNSDLGRFHYHH